MFSSRIALRACISLHNPGSEKGRVPWEVKVVVVRSRKHAPKLLFSYTKYSTTKGFPFPRLMRLWTHNPKVGSGLSSSSLYVTTLHHAGVTTQKSKCTVQYNVTQTRKGKKQSILLNDLWLFWLAVSVSFPPSLPSPTYPSIWLTLSHSFLVPFPDLSPTPTPQLVLFSYLVSTSTIPPVPLLLSYYFSPSRQKGTPNKEKEGEGEMAALFSFFLWLALAPFSVFSFFFSPSIFLFFHCQILSTSEKSQLPPPPPSSFLTTGPLFSCLQPMLYFWLWL